MADTPMTRTLRHLREQGYEPWIVERRLFGHVTVDLYNIADVLAVRKGDRPLLVQTTSGSNFAAREAKISASEHLPLLLEHFRVVLHGWAKKKVKRGGKAIRYELREAEFSLLDCQTAEAQANGQAPPL